jgi:hypothetical protein
VVELDLLPRLQDDLQRVAGVDVELLLARDEVGRRLEEPLRIWGDARRLCMRKERDHKRRAGGEAPGDKP